MSTPAIDIWKRLPADLQQRITDELSSILKAGNP
jgi:hypothetical protein